MGQNMQKTEYLRMALTPGYLKNLKSDRNQQVSDMVLPGLQFRYSARTGRKVFYLQYRVRGTRQQRHMRLGTLAEFTLGDIRGMALNLKREIANGHDPQIAQRQRAVEAAEREARRQKLKELAPIFLERHCRENNRANTYKSNDYILSHTWATCA